MYQFTHVSNDHLLVDSYVLEFLNKLLGTSIHDAICWQLLHYM